MQVTTAAVMGPMEELSSVAERWGSHHGRRAEERRRRPAGSRKRGYQHIANVAAETGDHSDTWVKERAARKAKKTKYASGVTLRDERWKSRGIEVDSSLACELRDQMEATVLFDEIQGPEERIGSGHYVTLQDCVVRLVRVKRLEVPAMHEGSSLAFLGQVLLLPEQVDVAASSREIELLPNELLLTDFYRIVLIHHIRKDVTVKYVEEGSRALKNAIEQWKASCDTRRLSVSWDDIGSFVFRYRHDRFSRGLERL